MSFKITYSIANDVTGGAVIGGKLQSEITADVGVSVAVEYIETAGDELNVFMASEPSAGEKTTIDGLVSAHSVQPDAQTSVEIVIGNAMDFGKALMKEYAAGNVLLGYDTAQIKAISNHLQDVQRYLDSGSLYVALDELQSLSPLTLAEVEIITQAQLDSFAQKISDYLGL